MSPELYGKNVKASFSILCFSAVQIGTELLYVCTVSNSTHSLPSTILDLAR